LKFSDDPSKNNGGLLINQMTGTSLFDSDQMDPKVFFVVDKLKVEEISAPVQFQTQEGKDAYRILYLRSRTDPHKANLKQDWDKIQEWALEDKKQQAIGEWIADKSETTYIKINKEFDDCVFLNTWASR
jgi:peptidyl-prolyl cis-trans isomerase SurA